MDDYSTRMHILPLAHIRQLPFMKRKYWVITRTLTSRGPTLSCCDEANLFIVIYKSLTLNTYIHTYLEEDDSIQPCGTNGKSKLFGRCSVGGLLGGHPGLGNPFTFRGGDLFCSGIDYRTQNVADKSIRPVSYTHLTLPTILLV